MTVRAASVARSPALQAGDCLCRKRRRDSATPTTEPSAADVPRNGICLRRGGWTRDLAVRFLVGSRPVLGNDPAPCGRGRSDGGSSAGQECEVTDKAPEPPSGPVSVTNDVLGGILPSASTGIGNPEASVRDWRLRSLVIYRPLCLSAVPRNLERVVRIASAYDLHFRCIRSQHASLR